MSETKSTVQVALVTGATRGIGAAIAHLLAQQGFCVIGTATTDEGAHKITQTLSAFPGCKGAHLNVNDGAAIESLLDAIVQQHGGPAAQDRRRRIDHAQALFQRGVGRVFFRWSDPDHAVFSIVL